MSDQPPSLIDPLHNLSAMHVLSTAKSVFTDIRGHIRDEAHQSNPRTYRLMRRLYVSSHGCSRRFWQLLFRVARRPGPKPHDDLRIASEVKAQGFAVRSAFLSAAVARAIRDHLEMGPVEAQSDLRIDYPKRAVLAAPGVPALLNHPALLAAARSYLGCQPIFTGVGAWQSLPSDDAKPDDYSAAAQQFHFDCDWPHFIKFFVYLTDVTDDSGPFAIIEGTHRHKPVWRDGRFTEAELFDDYCLQPQERRLTGEAGTLIAADTSAFHRGTPVRHGRRIVLQLEFAVSRLGASFQYPLLPAALRPSAPYRHTFDVFAATDY